MQIRDARGGSERCTSFFAHKMSLQVRKPKHRGTKRATSFGARIYLGSCFTLEWGFAGTFDRQIGNLCVLGTSGLINTILVFTDAEEKQENHNIHNFVNVRSIRDIFVM